MAGRAKDPGERPPVDLAWRDTPVPETAEAMAKVISRGVARALELACTAKELSEAVKVAADWYKTLYGEDEGEAWGSGLRQPAGAGGAERGNGHGG